MFNILYFDFIGQNLEKKYVHIQGGALSAGVKASEDAYEKQVLNA